MLELTHPLQAFMTALPNFLRRRKYHIIAFTLISLWCSPYFTTGTKLEWGDFSFFSQAYEAMRVSILKYHEFPWWNPWMSGGVPLYANPQMGVFSIQLLLTLLFGAPIGLKLAIVVYTFAGYGSMYLLLRKYFKIDSLLCTLLSLIWLFCTFFVAHLPAHFTFVWYMLAPLFIYLALMLKDWKSGLWFGLALAIMANSQIHNPFMHISFVCMIIFGIRALRALLAHRGWQLFWRPFLIGLVCAGGIFLVLAGHRFLLTYQNVTDFSHEVSDPTPVPQMAILGILLPLSMARPLQFLNYPQHPLVPYGFGETTATIGICALMVALMSIFFVGYQMYQKRSVRLKEHRLPLVVLLAAAMCGALAFGRVAPWAPYSILKHMPVFSTMRVSTRWYVWFDLAMLIFIGLVVQHSPKKSFFRFTSFILLCLSVIELLALNLGYQSKILTHQPVVAPKPITSYTFAQTAYFGQDRTLPDGGQIPNDGQMPHAYREYEATTFNLGILYANDALVQLALDSRRDPGHPTCPYEEGCGFVHTNNAKITYWSPDKIVLQRTGPGAIKLNANDSNYFVIDGKRHPKEKVAEPFTDFTINEPDSIKTITIEVKPTLATLKK